MIMGSGRNRQCAGWNGPGVHLVLPLPVSFMHLQGEVDLAAAAAAAGPDGEQPAQPQRLTGSKRKHEVGSTEVAEPAAEQPASEAAGDAGAGEGEEADL